MVYFLTQKDPVSQKGKPDLFLSDKGKGMKTHTGED